MKKTIKNIFILVVFAFLGYLAARFLSPGGLLFPAPQPDTVMVTRVVPGDPVLVEVETTVPDPVLIDTGTYQIIEVMQDVDTAEILADYFRTRQYTDTITNDTSFRAVYSAKVHRNRLATFNFQHQNLRKTAIYETHVHHYNRSLLAGVDLMLAPNRFNIGPTLIYHNKNETYSLSAGLLSTEIRLGYHRTLWRPEKPP